MCVGEMVGVGEGQFALPLLLTINKGTSPFNFQSNEHFSNLLRQVLRYESALVKKNSKKEEKKNNRFIPYRSLLRHCTTYDCDVRRQPSSGIYLSVHTVGNFMHKRHQTSNVKQLHLCSILKLQVFTLAQNNQTIEGRSDTFRFSIIT